MSELRNLVFIKNDLGDVLVSENYSEAEYEKLLTFSKVFESSELVRILDILQNSFEKLKFASIVSLPLEIAIVEICLSENQQKSAGVSNSVVQLESANQSTSRVVEKAEISEIPVTPDLPISRTSDTTTIADSPNSDMQKIRDKWTYVCETIRPFNFSLEALLRSIKVAECNDVTVVMEVPYAFHQRILEAPKNRDLVESILSEILGRSIRVVTVLGSRPERREDVANIEVAADDEIIRAAAEIFSSDTIN